MIKIVLIVLTLLMFFLFFSNRNSSKASAGIKLAVLTFVGLAIFVVIFPSVSNDIAHFLGVGRGADLILYMLTIAFIFFGLTVYIKSQEEKNKIVILARKIALFEASESQGDNQKLK